ncbi:hypothetical protein O9K51_08733 [Purpureocillium lavendulum]|uniref:Uncharacterized protein n=1 Tax=Purpureocillium lavendulum TaxID=1247861 RepID=A0AB34FFD2_9HYPO|nr:hypothetical protein O9K51_08733 [Purpureocillium lavendulum]
MSTSRKFPLAVELRDPGAATQRERGGHMQTLSPDHARGSMAPAFRGSSAPPLGGGAADTRSAVEVTTVDQYEDLLERVSDAPTTALSAERCAVGACKRAVAAGHAFLD